MIDLLRQLLFTDLRLKLFSLGLALLIWATVNFAIQKEVSPLASLSLNSAERSFFNLPVAVLSSAEDVREFKVAPKEVEVTVQGDPRSLRKLTNRDIRVLVDLTGIETASELRKRVEVSTPAGVTHVRVEPQEVQIIFPSRRASSDTSADKQ